MARHNLVFTDIAVREEAVGRLGVRAVLKGRRQRLAQSLPERLPGDPAVAFLAGAGRRRRDFGAGARALWQCRAAAAATPEAAVASGPRIVLSAGQRPSGARRVYDPPHNVFSSAPARRSLRASDIWKASGCISPRNSSGASSRLTV